MKIKVSDYIANFMTDHGVTDVFTVTGGGAMHLNDSLGHKEGLYCTYNHHEQACAIAAEGYTRLTGRLALVCVTSGPGGTNALTGVMGGWVDSIPMFVISGQVKRETTLWSTDIPLRQLGDQEFNIVDSVQNMTKYAVMITNPERIRYHLEKAWYLANIGRGGPVWLDIPLDVQAAIVDSEELIGFETTEYVEDERTFASLENKEYAKSIIVDLFDRIKNAKCPLILAGTGIRLGNAYLEFLDAIEVLQIPVVTAWNAHDLLWKNHHLFVGKPGTVGTRGGNFIVQNCDLLLVLGCRMNIRMISYNRHQFAKNAYKIVVDVDANELKKPTVKVDMPIHADVKNILESIIKNKDSYNKIEVSHQKWLRWCHTINEKYPVTRPEFYQISKPMNPYAFLTEAFKVFEEEEVIVCGNGAACVMTFQAADIKPGQRLFTNSGCAAMGYGFPAAIGCAVANRESNKRVVCIDGDGSFQMNLQELQTVVYNQLNIKVLYLNNNGYHSIRQTQHNTFKTPLVGVCNGNGLSFPNVEKLAYAYGINYVKIDDISEAYYKIKNVLDMDGPVFAEVVVDEKQNFEPKLSSRTLPDGAIVSPELDDMFPFLERSEYEENKYNDSLF